MKRQITRDEITYLIALVMVIAIICSMGDL
jgi:hypothetical protein